MIACKGDDEMGRICDADGNQWDEKRGCSNLPHTGRSKQDKVPDLVARCNLSTTMSPLQCFLLRLFHEKGIKNPENNVEVIVDSQSGMIVGHEVKGAPASWLDAITASEPTVWEAYELNNTGSSTTAGVGGWSEMNELMESSVEKTVEDSVTSFVSVFPVDSSIDQDILGHCSYRSIDVSISAIKDEVNSRTNKSPTSIVDMLGLDDFTKETNNPWCPFLLSGQGPHPNLSTFSGNG